MAQFDDARILETPVDSRRVFDGLILHIDHVTNRLPNGKLADREIARHVGASAVVPVDADGNVWMVKQFRAPIDRILLEVPAGTNASACTWPGSCPPARATRTTTSF